MPDIGAWAGNITVPNFGIGGGISEDVAEWRASQSTTTIPQGYYEQFVPCPDVALAVPDAVVVDLAREAADAARDDRGPRNKVAVIVTINSEVTYGYNREGIINKEVQNVLDANGRPNGFNRQCAEINAISKALNKGYDLTGAAIAVVKIGGPNSATHGIPEPPCDVCARLILYYGMIYVPF